MQSESSGANAACAVNTLTDGFSNTDNTVSLAEDDSEPGTLDSTLTQGRLKKSETSSKLDDLFDHLPECRAKQLAVVIHKFPASFSDTPGRTPLIDHNVDVVDAKTIKQRFYRVNIEKCKYLEAEIKYMLDHGIA